MPSRERFCQGAVTVPAGMLSPDPVRFGHDGFGDCRKINFTIFPAAFKGNTDDTLCSVQQAG
jgi:hypothetical protein